jgi:hypothetical protein
MISEQTRSQIQVYRYRWVVITEFAAINIVVRIQCGSLFAHAGINNDSIPSGR